MGGTYNSLLRDTAVALTAAGIDNARFEARLLMAQAASLSVEQLISRGRDPVSDAIVETVRSLAARRVRHEPMAQILGEREFWGLPFKVTPDVLVPRPDSETLIEAVLSLMPDRMRPWRILDLGVGSGCLLLTLLREFPKARGVGIDASGDALAVASDNAERLGVASRAELIVGDWRREGWAERLGGPFDLVVSNPPYIRSAAIDGLMPEVSKFEPKLALDGGPDGLESYRLLAANSRKLVTSGGYFIVEVGEGQAPEVSGLFAAAGLVPRPPWKDLGGIERVVAAHH